MRLRNLEILDMAAQRLGVTVTDPGARQERARVIVAENGGSVGTVARPQPVRGGGGPVQPVRVTFGDAVVTFRSPDGSSQDV